MDGIFQLRRSKNAMEPLRDTEESRMITSAKHYFIDDATVEQYATKRNDVRSLYCSLRACNQYFAVYREVRQ